MKITKRDIDVLVAFIQFMDFLKDHTLSSVPAPYYVAYRLLVMGKHDYKDKEVEEQYIAKALTWFIEHDFKKK